MKTPQYRAIVIQTFLAAAAALAFPNTQHRLFAVEPGGQTPEQEQKYIAVLKSGAALSEKARACQQLALVGTKNAASVDEAFRRAMGRLKGGLLAGVINSIGARHDAKAVGELSKLARDPASVVAGEAIAALGRIATDQAIDTIVHVLVTGSANIRIAAADACLAGAERRLEQDKRKEAVKLYDTVRNADVPGHLRTAATYGAILARGNEGISLLIEQLRTDDPSMVEIALRAARELPGPEVTGALVAELNKSEPASQVLLIKVLVDREDPSAYESIKDLASSNSPKVRIESLKVLGHLGDASAVPVLLKAAAAQGEEAAIAGAALRTIEADGVDRAIVKGELIGVLADRHCTTATAALLSEAASQDDTVATAAFKALTALAGAKDLPALVELLVGLRSDRVRIHAENAVTAINAPTKSWQGWPRPERLPRAPRYCVFSEESPTTRRSRHCKTPPTIRTTKSATPPFALSPPGPTQRPWTPSQPSHRRPRTTHIAYWRCEDTSACSALTRSSHRKKKPTGTNSP